MIDFSNATELEKKIIKKVYKQTFKTLKQKNIFKVELCFLSQEDTQALNREKRNVDKVTDVLSFPYLEIKKLPISCDDFADVDCDEKGKLLLGSIAICRKRAEEQAYEYGHSVEREIAFLSVHGLLHLLGFDHEEGELKCEMFELQEKILQKCKIRR